MSHAVDSVAALSRSSATAWATWALAALGASTVALAALNVYQWQDRSVPTPPAASVITEPPAAERLPTVAPTALPEVPSTSAPTHPPAHRSAKPVVVSKQPSPHVQYRNDASKKIANPVAKSTPVAPTPLPEEHAPAWQRERAPAAGIPSAGAEALPSHTPPPAQRAVCAQCGTVETITPVTTEGKASGAGAVAGALLGGLLGNQVGGGDGKTLATMAGVIGGAWAGDTVEKRMKPQTSYRVAVRMDDGSLRTVEQSSPGVGVGARVQVQSGVLSPVRD